MAANARTALVTGGGTGIGAAVALALAARGFRVAIAGRRQDKLDEVVAAAPSESRIEAHTVDVAERDSVNELVDWATRTLGRIDVLVNSAGVNVQKRSMAELSPDDWDFLVRVNATGAYNCMRSVLPQMRERRDGVIVNVSSVAGKRASMLGGVGYSASKFAMTALGLTAGEEERQHGIRITNIYPGEVETPILDQRPVPVTEEHRARILQPADVAAAVVLAAELPPRARIPELVIVPTTQPYV